MTVNLSSYGAKYKLDIKQDCITISEIQCHICFAIAHTYCQKLIGRICDLLNGDIVDDFQCPLKVI